MDVVGPDDSPDFKQLEADVEKSIAFLEAKCTLLKRSSKKYIEGLHAFSKCQEEFASSLAEFCEDMDTDEFDLGGEEMKKMVGVFVDLSNITHLLEKKTESTVLNTVRNQWLKGVLADGIEARKVVDQKRNAFVAIKNKVQGRSVHQSRISELFRGNNAEQLQEELSAAEAAANKARCNALRTYYDLQGRQSYEFLRMFATNAQNHIKFFEKQARALGHASPEVEASLILANNLEQDEKNRELEVAQVISSFEQVRRPRHSEDDDRPDRFDQGAHSDGNSSPTEPWTSQPTTSVAQSGQLEANGHRSSPLIKQGYLRKKSSSLLKAWKSYYFKLDTLGHLTYQSEESQNRRRAAESSLHLKLASVKLGGDETDPTKALRFCFRVVTQERILTLQASSEEEMNAWIAAIQETISRLLTDCETPRAGPQHPRHSRNFSSDGYQFVNGPASSTNRTIPPIRASNDSPRVSASPISLSPRNQSPNQAPPAGWMNVNLSPSPHRRNQSMDSQGERAPQGQSPHETSPSPRRGTNGGESPRNGSAVSILRQTPGNERCADCGAKNPEWASLNLGVLICLNCSGIHRNLSTDVSKVRGVKLDVRVWQGPVLNMMASLGNQAVNSAWEETLMPRHERSRSALDKTSRNGLPPTHNRRMTESSVSDRPPKPTEASSQEERNLFIRAKYMSREFVTPKHCDSLQLDLLRALRGNNLTSAMTALARGAKINEPLPLQFSDAVMSEADDLYPPQDINSQILHMDSGTQVILAACKSGTPVLFEYLLQNGADIDASDGAGRTLLHYAVIFSRPDLAQYLVERNADRTLRDSDNTTAYDMATAKKAFDRNLRQLLCP